MNDLALFNNFFDDFEDDGFGMPSFNFNNFRNFHTPKVDVKENKDAYTLQMDVPEKTDKDVKVELNHNVLTISSENETEVEKDESSNDKNEKSVEKSAENSTQNEKVSKEDKGSGKKDNGKWLVKERTYSKFTRSFSLPEDVDCDKISAEVKNGVLSVKMPRHSLPSPKRIAISCA